MARQRHPRLAFNRGLVDPLAGARQDVERLALSADVFYNYTPRKLGPMSLRVGSEYIDNTLANAVSKSLRFVRSSDNMARLEVTAGGLRVYIDDVVIDRENVASALVNGTFPANLGSWIDSDESGGTSEWETGGFMSLRGNGTDAGIREQQVAVAGDDEDVEHALRIVIERGPVKLRIGSSQGGQQYLAETILAKGEHSIAFTPTGSSFWVQFRNERLARSYVDYVLVEAGPMIIATPWAAEDLQNLRYDQSADVMYVGCQGYQQRRIERRGDHSWSLVLDQYEDGPFRLINVTSTTLSASAITGDMTLTASVPLFQSGHAGALFRMTSSGQLETANLSGDNQFTDPIRVIGVGGQRDISILISGVWTATVTLQMSIEEPGSWVDVESFTTNQSISYSDELDNQEIYYRLGIKSGDYGSGTAVASLVHTSGVTVGVVRINTVSSTTVALASVLDTLGAAGQATADWYEGAWSDYRGWPNVPVLFEGRLFHWGRDKVFGSVSELYDSHDDTVEGDTAPIQRSLGDGPVEVVHWVAPMMRMIAGIATMSANVDCGIIEGDAPVEARSSSFDEPLTALNFNTKRASAGAVYVDSSAAKIYEVGFNVDKQAYASSDLNLFNPGINAAGITVLGVQSKPDLRIHCRREDGAVGILVFDRVENVICWYEYLTAGIVEDVCILPGPVEDQVYYTVQRYIDGAVVRFHEKMALESECIGGSLNKQADAFVAGPSVPPILITDVTITSSAGELTILVDTGTPHGLAANDRVSISGVLASGHYDLNGRQVVQSVLSVTQFRVVTPAGSGGYAIGAYVSGGQFPVGAATAFNGLDHLVGETVVAWGDGRYLGEYVVDATGRIDFDAGIEVGEVIAGLPYTARWQSTRNSIAEALGIGANMKLEGLGLVVRNTHASGIRYGQDFDHMSDLPLADLPKRNAAPDRDHVYVEKEFLTLSVNGVWDTSSRLCLESHAPKPATILAAVAHLEAGV